MNCGEFEKFGMDAERDESLSAAERASARQHAAACARCAALQESWSAASQDLRLYAAATSATEAPARVEMRLRQEFYTKHHTMKARRFANWLTAALATVATIVGFVAWHEWQTARRSVEVSTNDAAHRSGTVSPNPALAGNVEENAAAENLSAAAEDTSEFLPLPGMVPTDAEDAPVVRVRMQRAALAAWGFPVSEDRAEEWIQVDLLVGDDGQPQAVRLSP
jgi:hypothetical protein